MAEAKGDMIWALWLFDGVFALVGPCSAEVMMMMTMCGVMLS